MKQADAAETSLSQKKSPTGDKSVENDGRELGEGSRVSEGTRGSSNTPRPALFSACIDYLKVTFDWMYMPGDKQFDALFKILLIDNSTYAVNNGNLGYEVKQKFDEGLYIQIGGENTKNALGHNTTLFEMQGHACRLFEERLVHDAPFEANDDYDPITIRSGWLRLLEQIASMGGKCTRIDLPTDDLTGIVPFEDLREKVKAHEYTTNMRSFRLNDQMPHGRDSSEETFTKTAGYSATFGSRDTVQLCIYNKLAERLRHGGTVNTSFWIRYEVRYYHQNAVRAFDGLLRAYEQGKEVEFIAGCLAGCISFKEKRAKGRNTYEMKAWDKWEKFLANVESQEISCRTHSSSTLESNAQWVMKETARIFAVLVAIMQDKCDEMFRYIAENGTNMMDFDDFTKVNNYLMTKDRPQYKNLPDMALAVTKALGSKGHACDEFYNLFFGGGVKLGSAKYTVLPGSQVIDLSKDDDPLDPKK